MGAIRTILWNVIDLVRLRPGDSSRDAGLGAQLAARGLLRVDDPTKAAEQLNRLVLIPLDRAMFLARQLPDQDELDRAADDAVEVFLTTYAPRQES